MSVYRVASAAQAAVPRFGGVNAYHVQANTTAEAKNLAASAVDGDCDAIWQGATVTDITTVPVLTGWVFTVAVNTTTPTLVSYTALVNDTLMTVGTALAALLVAAGHGTAHAAMNTGTGLLTVASIADNIGDKLVTVTVTPPTGLYNTGMVPVTPYGAIVNGGLAGAVLTVQLVVAWVIPGIIDGYRQPT